MTYQFCLHMFCRKIGIDVCLSNFYNVGKNILELLLDINIVKFYLVREDSIYFHSTVWVKRGRSRVTGQKWQVSDRWELKLTLTGGRWNLTVTGDKWHWKVTVTRESDSDMWMGKMIRVSCQE